MKKIFSLVVASLVAGSAFADDLAEGVYYIKSASSDVYLTRGQLWGTQAVVEPYGHPWKVTLSEGKYKLQMYDIFTSGETVKSLGIEGYVDQSGNKVVGLDIAAGATEGSYSIAANGQFVSPNESNAIAYGATSYDWKFISSDEYKANQEAAIVAQEAAVAAEAGIDLTGTNLAAYVAENYVGKAITAGFAPVPVSGGVDWTFNVGRSKSTLKYGDYGIECYEGSGSLTQSLTGMTKGLYKVGIKAMQRSVSNAACFALGGEGYVNSGCYLNANGKTVNVKDWYSGHTAADAPNSTDAELAIANNGGYYSEVYTYVGEDGKLDLTVNFPSYWGASWFIFNGIDIVYYLDKNSGTAPLIAEFDGWVAQADSLLALPMAEDIKTALETAKVAPTEDSVDAYTDAISALKNAVAAALVSTKKYDNVPGHDVTSLATDTWTNQGNRYQGRIERWNNSTYVGDVLTQTISGLVPGAVYELVIEASVCTTTSRDNIAGAAEGDGLTVVFANEGEVNAPCIAALATENFPAYTVTGTVDKEGNLKFGIKNIQLGANWFTIRLISITTKGNPTVDAYQTAQAAIAPVSEALAAADAAIVDPNYTDIVATFRATLDGYVATTNSVIADVDSLFAEVALLPQVDSLVAALPTVESINTLVTEFQAEIEALAPSSDPIAGDYTTIKAWNFAEIAKGDTATDGSLLKTVMTYSDETISVGGTASNIGTDYYEGLAMQGANKFFYFNGGLYSGNGGGRKLGILELLPGQRVIIKTNGVCFALADASNAEEVSVETEDGVTTYVYDITAEGMLALTMTRYFSIYSIDIQAKTKVYTVRYYDFAEKAKGDTATDGSLLKTVMTYLDETVSVGGTASNIGTDYYEGLAMQGANKFFYFNGGLYSGNGGGRKVGILDVEAGQTVTVKTNGECMTLADASNAEVVSAETVDGVTTYVYNITADGTLALTMTRYFVIYSISVAQRRQVIATVWDFAEIAKGDTATDGSLLKTVMTYSDETVSVGGTASNIGTGYFEGLAMQGANKFFYFNGGLYSGNGGGRKVGILDLSANSTVIVKTNGACMSLADASNAEEVSVETVDGVTTYVYNITADGILALTMTRYFSIYSIEIYAPKSDLQKPVVNVVAHGDWEYAPVVLTCKTKNAKIYYTLSTDPETVGEYVDTIKVASSCTLAAWSELNGKTTKEVTKNLTAGFVAAPTATLTAAKNEERTVVFASAATAAVLVVNGETVSNPYSTTISETTSYEVVAVYEGPVVGIVNSDTLKTTIEAGVPVVLNQVTFSVAEQSDTLYKILLNNNNTDLIGAPVAAISYELYPSGEKFDYTVGDTLKLDTHQRITAVANAEGYATSEPAVLWTREPAKLELVWAEDFKTVAEENLNDENYGVVLQTATFSAIAKGYANGGLVNVGGTYNLCPVQYLDGYVSNENFGVQEGTSWLERNKGGYLGLYNFNSGPRCFGVNNLRKTQVVKITVSDPTQVAVENDVLELDAANSVGNTLYYNCVKDGAAILSIARYLCIWNVEVYNNPDVTPSPNIYITGKEENGDRNVIVAPATFPYEENAWTYYAFFDSLRVDSTEVTPATEEVPAVFAYDTVAVYKDFQLYAGPIVVSKANNKIVAYTEYEGKPSDFNYVEIDCDSIYSLLLPTITWVEKSEEGHVFTVSDRNMVEQGLAPVINYSYNGQNGSFGGKSADFTLSGDGWFTVQAVLPGMDTAYIVSRYVASARESYNETYASILDGDTLTVSAITGDFESVANASVVGDYPSDKIAVGGSLYVHVALTDNYSTVALPFSFESGKNVVTNASGEALEYGVDYKFFTLHTRSAQNTLTNKDLSLLTDYTNIALAERNAGVSFSAGVPVLIEALSSKVGNEIILQNAGVAPVASTVGNTTVPTNGGWRLFGNGRYQSVALETPAFVLNAKGTKFVYTENPVVKGLGVAILVDANAVAEFGNEIVLVDESYKYTALNVTKDTLVWLNKDDMVAANAAGWACTDNVEDYASFQTATKKYTINPETDETVAEVSYTGIDVKNNVNKYLNLYVSGVDSLVVYGLGTSTSAERYLLVEAQSLDGESSASAKSEISTGNTVKVGLKTFGSETYRIRLSGPDGDMMVYAIKFIAGNASSIESIAADGVEGTIYDLQGRKVQMVKKGLYIVNGKPIQVK